MEGGTSLFVGFLFWVAIMLFVTNSFSQMFVDFTDIKSKKNCKDHFKERQFFFFGFRSVMRPYLDVL